MEDSKKPALAILIGQALAKKGKAAKDSPDVHAHLVEVATDLLKAIEAKDVEQVASLLEEAFEVCDAAPHQEGPHE